MMTYDSICAKQTSPSILATPSHSDLMDIVLVASSYKLRSAILNLPRTLHQLHDEHMQRFLHLPLFHLPKPILIHLFQEVTTKGTTTWQNRVYITIRTQRSIIVISPCRNLPRIKCLTTIETSTPLIYDHCRAM